MRENEEDGKKVREVESQKGREVKRELRDARRGEYKEARARADGKDGDRDSGVEGQAGRE